MKIGPTKHLVAAKFACLLWAMTAQAQQVPIPRSAAEVPGPVAGTAMTKEYVQMVDRMAYIWGWPLVNSHNRRAAFAKVSSSGPNGRVLPMAPVGQNAMLTESAPLIVDTDMGADDWMAILILLRSPKVDVKAITVTGAGLARIEAGTKNALNLLSLAAHKTIPVGKGGSTPLRGSHSFPEKWRESTDTMPGPTLRPNQNIPASKTAIDTIISVIEESPEKVTVLALGPLTNVAAALLKKPSIKSKLHMIYVMGGAVYVPGNVGATCPQINNSAAEWNMYIDPYSASVVFTSGAPVTLVPLDATNQVPVTQEFYGRLEKERITPEADFVFKVLTQKLNSIEDGKYFFWDPLAAAILVDESFATFKEVSIRVIESESDESGRTIPDNENGSQIRVCMSADSAQFQNFILNVINGQ